MSRLKRTGRGIFLLNRPRNAAQRAWAESFGFREKPSGEWVSKQGLPLNPSLEFLLEFGPRHICQDCKSPFRSKKQRDRFCPSCRLIKEQYLATCREFLLPDVNAPAADQRAAREKLEDFLACTYPLKGGRKCGWTGNNGRSVPTEIRLLLGYLPGWVGTMHRHFMHHALWNRFPSSRRFFPQNIFEQERQELYSWAYDRTLEKKMEAELGQKFGMEIDYPDETDDNEVASTR
jgi:hypothetical protein